MKWIDVRIGIRALVGEQLTGYRVPKNINIFYTLGVVGLTAFILQVITGIILLIYYIPDSEEAFRSVQRIMTVIPYGWLFRLMHVVGSNLMVIVLILHLFSVFFMGSYKKPRELTWIVGVSLLFLTLTFCLSGYLLPWSQLSYWATTIVTTMPTAFPYAGDLTATLLKGGDQVSGITLNRFFAAHVSFLPILFIILFGVHIFLVRRTGISAPPFGTMEAEKRQWNEFRHEDHTDGQPFHPYMTIRESYMIMFYLVILFSVIAFAPTLFLPEDANTPADPTTTPEHIKPEWYFLAFYQMLRIIPHKFSGIMLQVVLFGVFTFWPLLDTGEERNILKRPVLFGVFVLTTLLWIVLTIWGKYS